MLRFNQICWCNAYIGSTKKIWNNNISLFILGIKLDVCFFKLIFIKLILEKVIYILRKVIRRNKIILFIIPELLLFKSAFELKKGKPYNFALDLKNLTIYSLIFWVFGLLTNMQLVNKKQRFVSLFRLPNFLFVLVNKITEISDYANIAHEGTKLGILTFGICDSTQNPCVFDYAIPSNSKSFETNTFYYRLFLCYLYIYNIQLFSNFYFDLIYSRYFYMAKKKKKKHVK